MPTIQVFDREFQYRDEFDQSLVLKFLSFVDFRGENGCWIWIGGRMPQGYGIFCYDARSHAAHRIAHRMFNGPLADDRIIHHICKIPFCVNPQHLSCRSQEEHAGDHAGQKATCPQGHEFTPENTYLFRSVRMCRLCHKRLSNEHYYRKRDQLRKVAEEEGIPLPVPNKDKRVCAWGHPYDDLNTGWVKDGARKPRRDCLTCRRYRLKIAYYKKIGRLEVAQQLEREWKEGTKPV